MPMSQDEAKKQLAGAFGGLRKKTAEKIAEQPGTQAADKPDPYKQFDSYIKKQQGK